MSIDIEKARAETRHCEDVVHFNNAGSSLMPAVVSDSLHEFLNAEERYGGYETVEARGEALENFYVAVAKLLNCKPREVAFVENATRAWDMAFYALRFEPGDRILTTLSEYGSNVIAYLQQRERFGVQVEFVPNDEHGQIDVSALASMIDERVKLISISHIPTGSGLINPAAEIGEIANAAGITYLLDSCQGVGHIDLDVKAIGCDILSGTGRKYLRGPRGTGLLYVSDKIIGSMNPPLLDQHAATLTASDRYTIREDSRRFENWEQFFAGKAALGVAIDYALSWGLANIERRIVELAARLRSNLQSVAGIRVADRGANLCGIVTFDVSPLSAETLKKQLSDKRINVSVSSGDGNFILFAHQGLSEVVRASVHYFNTVDEVDSVSECIEDIVRKAQA